MEFIARTVVHPNGRLSKDMAESQLRKHPQFKPGSRIASMKQADGTWVAEVFEPKVAAPPFGNDGPPSDDSGAPTDGPPKPPAEDKGEDKPKDDKSDSDNKDNATGEKISLEKVMDLVQQIAQAVGVSPAGAGPDGPAGPPELDDLGPDGPPLGAGPHPNGPEGGPAHDETSPVPGSPDTKQIIHRKAPPGATPVGSPAFASVQKVATFEVDEEVPADLKVAQAAEEIESLYGQYGYKVKTIAAVTGENGERRIRAKVSVR